MIHQTQKTPGADTNMSFARYCAAMLLAAALGCVALSCSESPPQPAAGYPAPGEMRLIAATPLEGTPEETTSAENAPEAVQDGNLIRNGNFQNWWAGVSYPDGFSGAGDATTIRVRRAPDQGVIQEWLTSDSEEPVDRLFHTLVSGIRPQTPYRIEVTAASPEGAAVGISVFEWPEDSDENAELLEWPELILVALAPGEKQTLSRVFRSYKSSRIAIATHGIGVSMYPAAVQWISWRLTESSETEDMALPYRTPRFAFSQPRRLPKEITLRPDETYTINGWYVASQRIPVHYTLNGEVREADYVQRPDLDKDYRDYPHRTGWRIVLKGNALAPKNTLVISFNGEDRTKTTILVK